MGDQIVPPTSLKLVKKVTDSAKQVHEHKAPKAACTALSLTQGTVSESAIAKWRPRAGDAFADLSLLKLRSKKTSARSGGPAGLTGAALSGRALFSKILRVSAPPREG